ncbi:MAG: histidinol-phosphate aminotransferase family protein [Kofleriaceae bacterium]|nr:histidinol-phosphate aminotransferase family protein [Myxococcales bacterium]MCB9575244.1 histidinol-phosphate aminotransferase family protein [Kofleriaceae bacterium]
MEAFAPGEVVYALNPRYKDGTRLRRGPAADAGFNGVWVPNDVRLEIHAVDAAAGFAEVAKPDGARGWIRTRNLTRTARVAGVTRDVVTTEIVTPDPEYVRGIKIYNLGIKEDPVPGQKFGKGLQHLISSTWLTAMSEFVGAHVPQLQAFARHAHAGAAAHPGYDFVYFANTANQLFNRAEVAALRTTESRQLFLMATWLVMAAAEVDDFPFHKYTAAQRAAQRAEFYAAYLTPGPGPGAPDSRDVPRDDASVLGPFAVPLARRDLLPPIAMERLGINNELSALKYADAAAPLRDGFRLSTRIDSLKRHFEALHRRLTDEDHAIHLLWNFHAIYHVAVLFPDLNDLVDYQAARRGHAAAAPPPRYEPTTSRQQIAGRALPPSAVLKLDWNEGAIPPPPSVGAALTHFVQAADGAYLKWYPHLGGGAELRAALAAYVGVIEENLLVSNGSDDALVMICHRYLGPGRVALAPVPTYEHFCVDVTATGATLQRLDLADPFVADPDELAAAIERVQPTLVYLVSPTNPTGVEWTADHLADLATRYPDVVFLVDEAYHEFATPDAAGRPATCAPLAVAHRNVLCTRTFSKAFCLASVRCGYVVAHPTTIDELRAYYNPKGVNQFAQIAAVAALREVDGYYRPYIARTHAARAGFVADLAARGVTVRTGGAGNFVCVEVPGGDTAELCRRLDAEAIYVRDLGARFPGHVRITIGLEMSRVADAIVAALAAMAAPGAAVT